MKYKYSFLIIYILISVFLFLGCSGEAGNQKNNINPDQKNYEEEFMKKNETINTLQNEVSQKQQEIQQKDITINKLETELSSMKEDLKRFNINLEELKETPEVIKSAKDERLNTYWIVDKPFRRRIQQLYQLLDSNKYSEKEKIILQDELEFVKRKWWENKEPLDQLMDELGYKE